MKKNLLKQLNILLAGAMALSLAGCAQTTTTTAAVETESAAATTETTSEETTNDNVTTDSAPENTDDYANGLFDTSIVHTIDIEIADADWSDLLENPTDKTKYEVDVTIDDIEVEDVSFATKGNTSLSSVADSDSDRYSFKINFGKYVDDQTFDGLEKLNLNNIYADATYMKDYISYRIFQEAGSYAPQCSYIWVTVNGEDWGLYLALEDIGEDWLNENTDGEGQLYKPETSQLNNMSKGGPGGDDKERPERPDDTNDSADHQGPPDMEDLPDEIKEAMEKGEFMGQGGPGQGGLGGDGGFGSSSNGASLTYTDDEISSYSDIFDNTETDATDEDKQRVITALKGLSEASGEELEEYLDTDEIIRYFAAHNFVMNYDSYTGNMLHNYYLYENDGKLSMVPWDYNLAFGAFMGMGNGGGPKNNDTATDSEDSASTDKSHTNSKDATSIVNYGIDTPLSGAEEDSRPMWSWITENEEYLEQYHEVYDELLTNYFESGAFDEEIDRIYELILPYVEKDPTAYYTADEFQTGYETLKSFIDLRAESIRKQLDGSLSTRTDEQEEAAKVDASSITIDDMGTQGGHQGGGPEKDLPAGNQDGQIPESEPSENTQS